MGTVKGDLHDIGKNLCIMMLRGAGLRGHRPRRRHLGRTTFIDAVEEHRPELMGMSALLTTTMPNMGKTIEAFIDAGLRDDVKIMVGGAPVTQEFADDMGADGYGKDADRLRHAGARPGRSRLECLSRSIPEAYRQRLDRISEIFADDDGRRSPTSPTRRCPYKNRPTAAPRSSAAATSASRRVRAAARSAAATTSSTTAGLGDRPEPSRGAARARRGDADALRRRATSWRSGCRPRAAASGRCRECVVEVLAGAEHLCAADERRVVPARAVPARLPGRARSTTTREVEFAVAAPPAADRRRPSATRRGTAPTRSRRARRRRRRRTTARRRSSRCAAGVYGLAVDVGTTTVVLELVDLRDGGTVEVVALENPQRFGGSDVMNRISYDERTSSGELRQVLRRAINRELQDLLRAPRHRPPRGLRGRHRRQRDDARPLLRPRRRADRPAARTSR